jgi:hypothetical protein
VPAAALVKARLSGNGGGDDVGVDGNGGVDAWHDDFLLVLLSLRLRLQVGFNRALVFRVLKDYYD